MHTNLIIPSRCIMLFPIGAPHSLQIVVCPSGDTTSTTTPISFRDTVYKIKNLSLSMGGLSVLRYRCC